MVLIKTYFSIQSLLPLIRTWRIENLGAHFFVYANTGFHTHHARSQFCAHELPVRATQIVYTTVYMIMYFM